MLDVVALILVVIAGIAVVMALRKRATMPVGSAELGAEGRWLLRPLRELRAGLNAVAERPGISTEAAVIAREAVAEADAILERATIMLKAREELRGTQRGRGEAETSLGRYHRELTSAQSESERAAIQSAIDSRMRELDAYDRAEGQIKEIDGRLREAEATLAELKARLATASLERAGSEQEDEFTSMVTRLRTLGQSLDEARDTLDVKTQ